MGSKLNLSLVLSRVSVSCDFILHSTGWVEGITLTPHLPLPGSRVSI